MNSFNRLQQHVNGFVFEEYSRCAGAYRSTMGVGVEHACQNKNTRLFRGSEQLGNKISAAVDAKIKIEQDQIGLLAGGLGYRLGAGSCLAYDLEAGLAFDEQTQARANHRMVIHDQ